RLSGLEARPVVAGVARLGELRPELVGAHVRLRNRSGPAPEGPVGSRSADHAGKPRIQAAHAGDATVAPLPAPSSRRSVPSGASSRGRFRPWEGRRSSGL